MAKPQSVHDLSKKILQTVLGLSLLLSLSVGAISPALAASDEVRWSKVNIPAEGKTGDWVLADGSDIQHLTMAADGTLYAYAAGLTYTLYKSTNGGHNWSYIGNVQDSLVGIATAPNDAESVYYITTSEVYRSNDGGKTFARLPANPGGAGSNNIEITSIDVAWQEGNIIAIGTRDTDSAQFGGIYTLDEAEAIPTWLDTNLGSYDVYAVAFSPNFSSDRQLVAVATDETDTLVTAKMGDAGWGATIGNARLDKDNSGTPSPVAVATSAAIAFPGNYSSDAASENYIQFIAIDTGAGNGDVYRINGAEAPGNSAATDLNISAAYGLSNTDVTGLAVDGEATSAKILAGAAGSSQTYFSSDGGTEWTKSRKVPTGGSKTYVLMTPDFSSSSKAYTAISGSESAVSISEDNSVWNQIGLIDTGMSSLVDLAPSPNYAQDSTLFLLTFGGEHSLWRSLNSGTTWQRVFSSTHTGVDSIERVMLSPRYGNGSQVVFIAGSGNGNPALWESRDNGQNFTFRPTVDPTTGATLSIDTWVAVNDTTLFIGSYDGSNGLVYHTANSGFFYSPGTLVGSQSLNSVALSPNYEQDKTILIGNTNGWTYWSNNDGNSFEPLPPDAASPPLTGSITVAFDPDFENNQIVYAASATADKGVHRFTIGHSSDWESIDSTLPSGSTLNQLIVSTDGTLYAANSMADNGMERCLNPTYSLGPTFETATHSLSDGATLSGLWQFGERLWSIDTTNNRLITFNDILTSPATLISPADTVSGIGTLINHTTSNVRLDWEVLTGATNYQWQLDYDTDFSTVPSDFDGSTRASSVRLPTLEPATRYYWRVRATAPVSSPWSAKQSFTTGLDTGATALKLDSPEPGAVSVPTRPVFQWSAVDGADAYELLVSTDVHFANPSIVKTDAYALKSSAWQCDISLNYDTTYYWKTRAISADTRSAWSAVGAFTTVSLPSLLTEIPPVTLPSRNQTPATAPSTPPSSTEVTPPAPTPPMPPPPPAPTAAQFPTPPPWIVYLIGALLLTIILLLIVVLVLVTAIRHI